MKEYKIFMSKQGKDLFDAALKQQYQPSEENKKRLDDIHQSVRFELTKSQFKNELRFIELYGQKMLDFVKPISKEFFLATVSEPFLLSWDVRSDYENDDYWRVRFFKGKFDYLKDICGGYAGTETIEADISTERVIELIKTAHHR